MVKGVEIRAQIDTETVRGLQLMNGGMAAGLVTMLPSIIQNPNTVLLGHYMISAIGFAALGLVAAVVHNRLRRKCSLEHSRTDQSNRQPAHTSRLLVRCQTLPGEPRVCTNSIIAMWLAVAFFVLGAASVAMGFWFTAGLGAKSDIACYQAG